MVEGGDHEEGRGDAAAPLPASAAPASASEAPAPAAGTEAPAHARRLRGYVVAGAAVLMALVAAIALLAGGDGADEDGARVSAGGDPRPGDVLPSGGLFAIPDDDVESVKAAADAAGCELESYKVATRDHVSDPNETVRYSSSPPTSGRHLPVPAQDGAYEQSPDVMQLVHTLEHSRVIIWFKRDLPRKARASLKAYFDHDSYLLVLVPDTTGMEYEVAATAWHRNPRPRGTGRLLGCPVYNDDVYTALEVFKDRNRGRGPEVVP